MLKNHFKIMIRNILKHKIYSSVNIIGLVLGLTSSILIISYILYELSYDRYHVNAGRIYRLGIEGRWGEEFVTVASSNAPTASAMKQDYPEVENTVRFTMGERVFVQAGEKKFEVEDMRYADPSVFDIFSYSLNQGDPRTALANPYSAVITEELAKKMFGDKDPMNQTLKCNGSDYYTVTGIMMNVPSNSHLSFDMLFSFETLYSRNPELMAGWVPFNYVTYLLLRDGIDPNALEHKFPQFIESHMKELKHVVGPEFGLFMQPMLKIHLFSNLNYDSADTSDFSYVLMFSMIALFILLIACINFMNLSTARSMTRAKEIGMRKVLGSDRSKLISQFLGESVLYSLTSVVVAIALTQLLLPFFRSLSGKNLALHYAGFGWFLPGLFILAVFVGLAAGTYPALYMSSFQPARIVKGHIGSDKPGQRFRNGLVVVQFAISIMLMIGTGSIYNQVRFMKNKKLGFDKEQIIYLPIRETRIQDSAIAFKEEVKRFHGIAQAAYSNLVPVGLASSDAFIPEGYAEGTSAIMSSMAVDADYISTMGMEIATGRNFSADIGTDLKNAAILNETAVRRLGWTDPIGKTIQHLVGSGLNEKIQKTVVGVVKDFHYNTLHRAIDPMYISNDVEYSGARFLMIRIQGGQIKPTLEFLRAAWEKIETERPFRFRFLSDSLNRLYAAEEKLSAIFILFTGFAIVIACLGLFGLASFTAARRTKEIGIRKSLGASIGEVVLMLLMDFTKWVVIANGIAWPAIYFIVRSWLQNFTYRSPMRWEIFVIASGLALFTAVLTVSAQSIKAALTNPARSLRYE